MNLVAVIPAFNEAASIRDVAGRTAPQVTQVIVVDDGSTDGTRDALVGLPVIVLANEHNVGKGSSLWRGMQHALGLGADAVVTLDGDGQHEPEEIARLAQLARAHPEDIIIGARLRHRERVPRSRDRANRFANFWIGWAAGYRIEDSQSGFRLYPASVLRRVRVDHGTARGFVFESEMLIKAARLGVPSRPVAIDAIYHPGARASHFRPVRDIARITRMVAWQLLSRGLNPRGLYRSLAGDRMKGVRAGPDGLSG